MDDDHCLDAEMMDHLELAWGVIANVSGGNWGRQNSDWQEAAIRWRDRYHDILSRFLQARDEKS